MPKQKMKKRPKRSLFLYRRGSLGLHSCGPLEVLLLSSSPPPQTPLFLTGLRRLAEGLAVFLMLVAVILAVIGYLGYALVVLMSLPLGAAIFNGFGSPESEGPAPRA